MPLHVISGHSREERGCELRLRWAGVSYALLTASALREANRPLLNDVMRASELGALRPPDDSSVLTVIGQRQGTNAHKARSRTQQTGGTPRLQSTIAMIPGSAKPRHSAV
jgi:hypothetical protein